MVVCKCVIQHNVVVDVLKADLAKSIGGVRLNRAVDLSKCGEIADLADEACWNVAVVGWARKIGIGTS